MKEQKKLCFRCYYFCNIQNMSNFDDYKNENKTEQNLKWPYILDHPYIILIIRGSTSGKTIALLS